MTQPASSPQHVIAVAPKNMGVSIILSVLFGPLGMLYSTILGGFVMFFVSLVVGIFTLGFGLLLTWPICVIWAAASTSMYNNSLITGAKKY